MKKGTRLVLMTNITSTSVQNYSTRAMRRLLKAGLAGAALGDVSTLEDKGSLSEIKATCEELMRQLEKK